MRTDDDSLTGLDHARRGSKPSGGAIYHMKVRTASRSRGQSARAAAAYIERSEEYGRDPESAAELVYTESGHMPSWADAEAGAVAYWDAADLYERSNGRLYKSIEVALPLALDDAQRRELAVGFAHHLTDAAQLPYTLAIHAGKGANPHCHLMISERTNDGLERSAEHWFKRYNAADPEHGGAQKTTALHPKAWLLETRASWAELTNAALKEAGLELEIDHRSLAAQGIARVPGIHLGPAAAEMERRGVLSERGDIQAEINQINEKLRALEEEMEYERQRQRELEPRTVEARREAEAEQRPRVAVAAALEPADRDAERADERAYHRDSGLPARDRGVAGGDQPAPRGALPRGEGAERGAAAERGGGVEAGAGRLAGRTEHAEPLPNRLAIQAEPPSRGAGEAPRRADLGADPSGVVGDGVGDSAGRVPGLGRGADLPRLRAAEQDLDGGDRVAGQARGGGVGLSPEMGGGAAGRTAAGREEAGRQEGRAVDAAAVATAQAQLAAAEAAIERTGKQLGDAAERLERQAEQEARRLEKEKKLQKKLEAELERKRERGAERELDPFD